MECPVKQTTANDGRLLLENKPARLPRPALFRGEDQGRVPGNQSPMAEIPRLPFSQDEFAQ